MAVEKYYSAKKIIADYWRDLRPTNSSWAIDGIEWIALGLQAIGGGFNVEVVKATAFADNHRVLLPCNSESIVEVIYDSKVLPQFKNINITDFDITLTPFWKAHNQSYLHTSFEEGEIEIWYNKVLSEFDETSGISYPMIPDDGQHWVRLFLQEFILMKYLLRGNNHPVRKFAEVRAGIYDRYGGGAGLLHRAKVSAAFPSANDLETVSRSVIGLHKDWNKKVQQWFNTGGNLIEVNGESTTLTTEFIEVQFPTPE